MQVAHVHCEVDYAALLERCDLTWSRIPTRWELAPFAGNGNLGFLFYRAECEPDNVMSIHVGRADYHDHRPLIDNLAWIYRSRLPIGHFNLKSKGNVTGVDLRLDLWNAELTGTIMTTEGTYSVCGLTHAGMDVFYFEIDASGKESVSITWHPASAVSPIRTLLDREAVPSNEGEFYGAMRNAPYPPAPDPVMSESDGVHVCYQELFEHRGETTTGWEISGETNGTQVLTASVHHSFPEQDSQARVKRNLGDAQELLGSESAEGEPRSRRERATCSPVAPQLRLGSSEEPFLSTHRDWWHDYYPQSFVTFNDPEQEAFYWIQIYKLASASRADGPVVDNMGPWYQTSHWPMIWNDMNVEVIYHTHLTANRLSVGESLPNGLDRHIANLEKNVPEHWGESAAIQTACGQDWRAYDEGRPPDLLAWVLHDYWLHCSYAADRKRIRDGLFPLLKRVGNGYLNYLRDNPVESDDGKVHFKKSWSPEYPHGWGPDMHGMDVNFTIALCRWTCQTLLAIDAERGLDDPLAAEWRHIVDNLVELQVDEKGLRIGKEYAYDEAHRHYSHLLAFWPLGLLDADRPADRELAQTSVDAWIGLCEEEAERLNTPHGPLNPFAATGASSMYAWLGDGEKALHYLNYLLASERVAPTTMYAEGNPCIESPLSLVSCVHDMLLQSHERLKTEDCRMMIEGEGNGNTVARLAHVIHVFPAVPAVWPDAAFHQLRTQGAFLVSARKRAGETQFVIIKSLAGGPCFVRTDIPEPRIAINGKRAKSSQIHRAEGGFYEIALKKGDTATLTPVALNKADLRIEPLSVAEKDRHLFGFNEKTSRLPGHNYYHKETPG